MYSCFIGLTPETPSPVQRPSQSPNLSLLPHSTVRGNMSPNYFPWVPRPVGQVTGGVLRRPSGRGSRLVKEGVLPEDFPEDLGIVIR